MDYRKIGKRIRDARNAKGLTQEYIAEKLDIDPSFISRIENGHNKGSFETYVKICALLDTTLDYITRDDLPQAHKSIAEQEFHDCIARLSPSQVSFLIEEVKRFTDYSTGQMEDYNG